MDDPDTYLRPLLFLGGFRFLRLSRTQPFPLPPRKTSVVQLHLPYIILQNSAFLQNPADSIPI
jgi:hypothetical protein